MGEPAAIRHGMMQASLHRKAYCDAEVFADEQTRAMATSWVCVGRADAIGSDPGSYRLVFVAEESVLLVRAADTTIGAFPNRCMHQGTELVDTTKAVPATCFDSVIRCPYHFWAYGFDGSLRASPWVEIDEPADFAYVATPSPNGAASTSYEWPPAVQVSSRR